MSNNESSEEETKTTETTETPTVAQLQEQLASLQARLTEVNNESASRRRELKETKDQLATLQNAGKTDLERLQAQLAELQSGYQSATDELKSYKLKDAFKAAAVKSQIQWANEQAFEDAFTLAKPTLMSEEDPDYASVLKSVLTSRPYLTGTTTNKKAPDLNGRDRTSDEKELSPAERMSAKSKQLGNPRL